MARPRNQVLAEQPPPFEHDFDFLDEQARRSKCVFRVWETTSASPLVWNNFPSDSGFAAPNGNLARLSPTAYLGYFRENRGQVTWAEGLYMKQTVVDHILQRWRQAALNYVGMVVDEEGVDIPEDDKSPWISTSKDLTWCVWESARRLAMAVEAVDRRFSGTLGGNPVQKAEEWRRQRQAIVVNLAIIRHHSGTIALQDARRNQLESHIDPRGPTGRLVPRMMSVSLQGDFEDARRLAVSSGEILYYGRIFAANVESNLEWTIDRTAFALPAHFLRATNADTARAHTPGSDTDVGGLPQWLNELCWDPLHDDIQMMRTFTQRRRRDITRGVHAEFDGRWGSWDARGWRNWT